MPTNLLWAGIIAFSLVLVYDFGRNYLLPRLLSYEWFPGEPNLPPVAGEKETSDSDVALAILFAYLLSISVFIIGVLDYSSARPECIPPLQYVASIFALASGFMWYTDSKNLSIQYHSEIRYLLGSLSIVIVLYLGACGEGLL